MTCLALKDAINMECVIWGNAFVTRAMRDPIVVNSQRVQVAVTNKVHVVWGSAIVTRALAEETANPQFVLMTAQLMVYVIMEIASVTMASKEMIVVPQK